MSKLTVNFVHGCQASDMTPTEISWEELQTLLNQIHRKGDMNLSDYLIAPDKMKKEEKDGTAWIPCSTINSSGAREQVNMDKAYCLVLDIDTGMQLDDVKKRIEGYEAAIHTSYSNSPEHPKWRVVLPLLEPVPAKDIGTIFDHFQERFDGLLDSACGHDPARLYYLPACPADAEHLFHFEHLEGKFLDGKAILMKGSAKPSKSAVVSMAATKHTTSHASIHMGVSSGGRNNTGFKIAASLFNDGHSTEYVTKELLAWNEKNDPPLDTTEIHQVVKSAMKNVTSKIADANAIVSDMNENIAWVNKPHQIFRFKYRDFVKVDALHSEYANTKIKMRVGDNEKWQTHSQLWFQSAERRTHSDVDFIPGGAAIINNKINLWEGWGATPAVGDITPWTDFLDLLFASDPDARKWIEQWLAYPLQHPGAKLTTAVVLWSIKQGVGKSMLGETIGKIYGRHFRTITAVELHSSFNAWMRDSQFVLGEENSSSDQRADANRLKSLITGNTVTINEKFQPMLELPNCANFLFTSNHPDAFHLEDGDRRFFVWEINANRMPNEFYEDFIDWRDNRGGLNSLMDHLQKLDMTDFEPKGNAPKTEAKTEMIHHSKSDMERWINDALEDDAAVEAVFGKQVVTLDEVTATYNRERHARTTTTAVSKALRRQNTYATRRIMSGRRRMKVMSLINHDSWEGVDNPAWVAEFEKPTPISSRMSL
ncbi:MAG: DUF5906 domain-containing protein [Betaproteobacteria bacterium]